MKKMIAVILTIMVFATAAAYAAINVRAEYEGFGLMEVDFSRDVRWQDPQIAVTDAFGGSYTAELVKLDDDDIKFRVGNIIEDQVYNISISGIQGEETVNCEVYAASLKSNMIREVEYDADDRELDIEFAGKVSYEANCEVMVTDAAGKQYNCTIIEKDRDSIEVWADGLTRGETYTVTVSGVIAADSSAAETYSREFVARDD